MKVVVLGGNGFIGRNLCKHLRDKGYQVASFDLGLPQTKDSGVEYLCGNFFDDVTLEEIVSRYEIIFHAISTVNPSNSCQRYLDGYKNDFIQSIKLAELAMRYKAKIIYLSSGGTIYGRQTIMPIHESAKSMPINHYGNIKLCIENTFSVFRYLSNADIRIARIANPYGPGQDFKKGVGFIDAVLKGALNKEKISIFGTGENTRDYIYIDDVCGMLESLMLYEGEEYIFNVSTGVGSSQNEIVEKVKSLVPEMVVEYCEGRSIDVPSVVLDNSSILKIYEGELTSITDGISKYYSYLLNGK